jgi:protein-disulfide isomerase
MENGQQHNHDQHGHAHHENNAPAAAPAAPTSILNVLSPKQTFILGLAGGFLVLCTIGFFVLLSMYLKGNMPSAAVGTNPSAPSIVADDQGEVAPPAGNFREVDEKRDHVLGPKNAKVTMIEYSDFECPFCQRFQETVKQVTAKYGKDVRVVFRHFPLSFHAKAIPAANASECASEQGKFWEMHDMLFEKGVETPSGNYSEYAKALKLNVAKFEDCFKQNKYSSKIQEDQKDGQNAGVQGTPHSIIVGPKGEKLIVSGAQPFESVEAQLKSVL